jgi:hypothetical protein
MLNAVIVCVVKLNDLKVCVIMLNVVLVCAIAGMLCGVSLW